MAENVHGCFTVGADPRSKARLLVLPEIQELASAAPRNYWKLSEGPRFREEPIHTQRKRMKDTNNISHGEKVKRRVRESLF